MNHLFHDASDIAEGARGGPSSAGRPARRDNSLSLLLRLLLGGMLRGGRLVPGGGIDVNA